MSLFRPPATTAAHSLFSDEQPELSAAPPRLTGWRGAMLRLGRWGSVLSITAASIFCSLALTWTGMQLFMADLPPSPWPYVVAALVPSVVAPLSVGGAFQLLHDLVQSRARMHHAAVRDGLTGAYNRRFFMGRLDIEVSRARREAQPLALLMIDADHFKAINDTHGHAAGDRVLEELARAVSATLRPYDLLARYGGEEFVALLPGTTLGHAGEGAERVRRAIESMRVASPATGKPLTVTASLGVSSLGPYPDNAEALLRRADDALYAAKHGGRNRWSARALDGAAA